MCLLRFFGIFLREYDSSEEASDELLRWSSDEMSSSDDDEDEDISNLVLFFDLVCGSGESTSSGKKFTINTIQYRVGVY